MAEETGSVGSNKGQKQRLQTEFPADQKGAVDCRTSERIVWIILTSRCEKG
jgi:hypothetical protein